MSIRPWLSSTFTPRSSESSGPTLLPGQITGIRPSSALAACQSAGPVVFNGERFFMLGGTFNKAQVVCLTSADGITWTGSILPPEVASNGQNDQTWGYLSTTYRRPPTIRVVRTGDVLIHSRAGLARLSRGSDWTAARTDVPPFTPDRLDGLPVRLPGASAYSKTRDVVACGTDGIWTSDDAGETWTKRTSPAPNPLGVAYNGSLFCAAGWTENQFAETTRHVMTSSDGLSWTARSLPSSQNLFLFRPFSVTAHGTTFVLGGSTSAGFGTTRQPIYTSPNGTTWTARNATNDYDYGDAFVLGASSGSAAVLILGKPTAIANPCLSRDGGATWQKFLGASVSLLPTSVGSGILGDFGSIAYGNNVFVTGGQQIITFRP